MDRSCYTHVQYTSSNADSVLPAEGSQQVHDWQRKHFKDSIMTGLKKFHITSRTWKLGNAHHISATETKQQAPQGKEKILHLSMWIVYWPLEPSEDPKVESTERTVILS